jgi:predicted  nucleic acid-binding Zn-ribbon protein
MSDRLLFLKKKWQVVKKVSEVESAGKAQMKQKQQQIDKIEAQIKEKRKRMDADIEYSYNLEDDIQCLDERIVKWTGEIEIAKAQKAGHQELLVKKRRDYHNINREFMELEEEKKHMEIAKANFGAAIKKQINELEVTFPPHE